MKIRNGFVSNSSSTSFTFCFKGATIDALYDAIHKYSKHFQLSFDAGWGYEESIHSCNAQDVIDAIRGACARHSEYEWENITVVPIEDQIEELRASISEIRKELKKEDEKPVMRDIYFRHLSDLESHLNKLKSANKKGLTDVAVIGFGDNHGHISGGDVGYAMDYEGRNISIEKDDFMVFTEQNR